MADQVLLPAAHHPPWTERVAETVVDVDGAEATVQVLYVFDEADRTETEATLGLEDPDVDLDDLARRKADVSAAVDVLEDAGITHDVRGRVHDDRAEAILDSSSEDGIDRIYLYSRRRSPAGKAVFGSTLQDVIIGSAIPVVVIPSPPTESSR